jgi:hypothetical protein
LFVIKILVSKFFENKILRNPPRETRASQGFRRNRNKKNHARSAPGGQNALMARRSPSFILVQKSTAKTGVSNQPAMEGIEAN